MSSVYSKPTPDSRVTTSRLLIGFSALSAPCLISSAHLILVTTTSFCPSVFGLRIPLWICSLTSASSCMTLVSPLGPRLKLAPLSDLLSALKVSLSSCFHTTCDDITTTTNATSPSSDSWLCISPNYPQRSEKVSGYLLLLSTFSETYSILTVFCLQTSSCKRIKIPTSSSNTIKLVKRSWCPAELLNPQLESCQPHHLILHAYPIVCGVLSHIFDFKTLQ